MSLLRVSNIIDHVIISCHTIIFLYPLFWITFLFLYFSARRSLKSYQNTEAPNEPLEEVREKDHEEIVETYFPSIQIQESSEMEISSNLPSESWLLSNPFHPDYFNVEA